MAQIWWRLARLIAVARQRDGIVASSVGDAGMSDVDQGRWDICYSWTGCLSFSGNRLELIRCLTTYSVNLILILQAVFERKVTPNNVNEIIYEFVLSEQKKSIHNAIVALFHGDRHPTTSDYPMDKIKSLINEHEVRNSCPCGNSLLIIHACCASDQEAWWW